MERPLRERANTTGEGGFFSRLANPFGDQVEWPPTPVQETVGFMPTLTRMPSDIVNHHAFGTLAKPTEVLKGACQLKKMLSSSSKNDTDSLPRDIPAMEVTIMTPHSTQSDASTSSSQRIVFEPDLLKPTRTSTFGAKVCKRPSSPYPNVRPVAKQLHDDIRFIRPELMIRRRSGSARTDGRLAINGEEEEHLEQCLEKFPDALLLPGCTQAMIDWYRPKQRKGSDLSTLSDPEALDARSIPSVANSDESAQFESDDTSVESGDEDQIFLTFDNDYDSDSDADDEHDYLLARSPMCRQYTPAAHRPPLIRKAKSVPTPQTEWDDESPLVRPSRPRMGSELLLPPCHSPTDDFLLGPPLVNLHHDPPGPPAPTAEATDTDADDLDPETWFDTDPSNLPFDVTYQEFDVPHLLWRTGTGADGKIYSSSVQPASHITAGKSDDNGGASHTPVPPLCHRREDPDRRGVDAAELRKRLRKVQDQLQPEESLYDIHQNRIQDKYENWQGGVSWKEWEAASQAAEEAAPEGRPEITVGELAENVWGAGPEAMMYPDNNTGGNTLMWAVTDVEAFPAYEESNVWSGGYELKDIAALDRENAETDVVLPDYAAAEPRKGGSSPWSKTHLRSRPVERGEHPTHRTQKRFGGSRVRGW